MSYSIGYRGCQHLGYAARNMRMHNDTGWNLRVIDGHVAHELTMRDMLAVGVNGVFDGGDIAHWSQPENRDIHHMRLIDDLRVDAIGQDGLAPWYRGNTGNHDVGAVSAISAASALHRPALEAQVVYPGQPVRCRAVAWPVRGSPTRPCHSPVLAHRFPQWAPRWSGCQPRTNSRWGEPAVRARHFHRQTPANGTCGNPTVSSGSSPPPGSTAVGMRFCCRICTPWVRCPGTGRPTVNAGRSGTPDPLCDAASPTAVGPRGWLLVTLNDDGTVAVTARPVWQRPQHELPVINAAGLTAAEVDEQVTTHLGVSSWWDPASAELTGDGGYILRQRITGVSPSLRKSLNGLNWAVGGPREGVGPGCRLVGCANRIHSDRGHRGDRSADRDEPHQ